MAHDPARCEIDDCPICERIAEDRAEGQYDNPYELEWDSRRAGDRYEQWLYRRD